MLTKRNEKSFQQEIMTLIRYRIRPNVSLVLLLSLFFSLRLRDFLNHFRLFSLRHYTEEKRKKQEKKEFETQIIDFDILTIAYLYL